jgi:hypothetical protein
MQFKESVGVTILYPQEESMKFLNQHSFTLTAAATILIVAYLSLRGGVHLNQLATLGALILGLAVLYLLLRPRPSTLPDADQLMAGIGSGTPALLEFQSQY